MEGVLKEKEEVEKDLDRERSQREELETQLEKADRDGMRLKDEVERLNNELESRRLDTPETPDPDAMGGEAEEKRVVREMEENLRTKNKQIKQLLEDIEQVYYRVRLTIKSWR